ncbi:ABC transporter permease, partial [Burkholderia pyrrocinia]|uniref:ABC transporter permease n=1 Tax=Burkholderia pyrrocinia TaxID=60550 RepID=UPI00104B8791
MSTMLGFASRNLLRNPRRSAATLLSIALGVFALLIFSGLRQDLVLGIRTYYVQTTGHLQIQHRDFYTLGSGNPAAYGIKGDREIISALELRPELRNAVAVITPTLQFGGIAGNFSQGKSSPVFGRGFIPLDAYRMLKWNEYDLWNRDATSPLLGQSDVAAVVGRGVARVLQLCAYNDASCVANASSMLTNGQASMQTEVGAEAKRLPVDIAELADAEQTQKPRQSVSNMELLVSSPHGMPNVAATEIAAVQMMALKELDDTYVGINLPLAQRLVYGSQEPQSTSIHIQLRETASMDMVKQKLKQWLMKRFPEQPLVVRDYIELYPAYSQVVGMFSVIFGFVAALISLIVTFSMSSTMSMAVMERTVEIGTLRAIGFQREWVQKLFLREALILGAIGAIVGVLLSWFAQYLINNCLGLQWQPPGQSEALPLHVRIWGEWVSTTCVAGGAIALACLSSWVPARRASHVSVV